MNLGAADFVFTHFNANYASERYWLTVLPNVSMLLLVNMNPIARHEKTNAKKLDSKTTYVS